jgi:hypothetical protein
MWGRYRTSIPPPTSSFSEPENKPNKKQQKQDSFLFDLLYDFADEDDMFVWNVRVLLNCALN